jgi:hypothetical protein
MQDLRKLVDDVREAKKLFAELQYEFTGTADTARYDELRLKIIPSQTNVVYNAAKALETAVFEQMGVTPSTLYSLIQSFGYILGKNVEPKANVDLG